jgi:hypothetical protein
MQRTSVSGQSFTKRLDESIFSLSMLMGDQCYARCKKVQKQQLAFYSKGRIDYTPANHQ